MLIMPSKSEKVDFRKGQAEKKAAPQGLLFGIVYMYSSKQEICILQ